MKKFWHVDCEIVSPKVPNNPKLIQMPVVRGDSPTTKHKHNLRNLFNRIYSNPSTNSRATAHTRLVWRSSLLSRLGLDPVSLSKIETHLLTSLGSKGKNRNSLACLRNACFHFAVTYCSQRASQRALSWRRARCCRRAPAGGLVHVPSRPAPGARWGRGGAAAAGARGARAGRPPGGCWHVAAHVHAQARSLRSLALGVPVQLVVALPRLAQTELADIVSTPYPVPAPLPCVPQRPLCLRSACCRPYSPPRARPPRRWCAHVSVVHALVLRVCAARMAVWACAAHACVHVLCLRCACAVLPTTCHGWRST